ncbi:MAG TPA: hypothetical protein VGQ59_01315 [Cyclobacteriaceae bacterium]|nr:hypothetical protein [Cyclobacteriaceae bacterium]
MKVRLIYNTNFAWFVLLFGIASCQRMQKNYFVTLDDHVRDAIKSYVKENRIDVNSGVITTDWLVNPYRTDVYISNTSRQFTDRLNSVPSYYSLVSDSIIVLIYSGVENGIIRNTRGITLEINDLLVKKHVKLFPKSKYVDHTRTWLYTLCNGNGELIREPSISDLFYIPCRAENGI